jgi:hypothetical protein
MYYLFVSDCFSKAKIAVLGHLKWREFVTAHMRLVAHMIVTSRNFRLLDKDQIVLFSEYVSQSKYSFSATQDLIDKTDELSTVDQKKALLKAIF